MGTTISGSIEASNSRQGVEINDFQQVYASMLPRLMSNSSPSVIVDGRRKSDGRTFDDSIVSVLSQGTLKVVPNHEAEQRDLGMPKSHYTDTPYLDIGKIEPVGYIQSEDLQMLYPVILDDVSPVDPGNLDGVIEPFTIRDTATRRSVEGSYSSRRIRGGISSYGEDLFGYNIPLQQIIYSEGYGGMTRPYQEYGIDSLADSNHGFSYLSDDPVTPSPYIEDDDRIWESSATPINDDDEIVSALSGSMSRFTPYGAGFRSSAAGYTYLDNVNGTDSIAFFDRKGY
jgi:hypothetical protein